MNKSSQAILFQPRRIRVMTTVLAAGLLIAALLGGCNLPSGRRPSEPKGPDVQLTQDLSLLTTLTQQAEDGENTASTTAPLTTAIPTATQLPPTESSGDLPSHPTEIKFRTGGTIAFLKGAILGGEKISYTVNAGAGQTLIAGVSSNNQEVYFEVKGLNDGRVLASFSDQTSSITALLTDTQDYQITLYSPLDNVYFLSVEVPANLAVEPGSGLFTIDGYLDVFQAFHPDVFTRVRYLLELEAGTVLNVQLRSEAIDDLTLALTGIEDKVPYLRYAVKSEAINDFPVMVSQKYYLDVYAVSGLSADYKLEIEVSQ